MELLTVREAAQLTRMSASWWRQRIFRKEIEHLKIGRSVKIRRSTVNEFLEQCHVPARGKREA